MATEHEIRRLFLFNVLSLSFAGVAIAVELAPFFDGYTIVCTISDKSGQKLMAWLRTLDDNGAIDTKPTLPADLAAVLGNPIVINHTDHWLISVPVNTGLFNDTPIGMLSGTFYSTVNGVKIVRIERWAGKDNGIYRFAIVFDASPAVIKAAFRRVRFKTDEMGVKAMPLFDKVTDKSSLVCDSSN